MSSPGDGPTGGDPTGEERTVALSAEEASAVGEVVVSYARALPDERQQPYLDLLADVQDGTVTSAQIPVLEQICALSLETGQARRLGLAEVETLVATVYRRTPEGRARSHEARDVNEALGRLTGQELRSARLNWSRPGRYTLTLGVTGFDLTVVITPTGLEVQSLTTT